MPDTRTDELAQVITELLVILRANFVDGPFSSQPTAVKVELGRSLAALEKRLERITP